MKIIYAPLILPLLLFFFCTDEYSVEIRDAMIDTVSGNQNVVIINYYYDTEDWKNVMDFDITLKNDVRMYIAGCKRNKNGEFIYRYVSNINNWSLYEIIHYEDSDKYESKFPKDTAKDFLGNNSLEYLLENYQKLYDFYMSVPEFSAISYNKDKETFDNIPDEFVFDVYDEESCKVIGVGKLYRVKKEEALTTSTGQLGFSPENGKQGGSRGTYTHMFVSTVAYGGTIFWKKNPDYMRAKGEKEKRRKGEKEKRRKGVSLIMKKIHTLFSFLVLCTMIGYFLLPVDFIWFVATSLVIGIAESMILLFQKRNRKIGLLVLFVETFSLATYLGFMKSAYHYYHFAWNVVYFILTLAIFFAPCYIVFFQRQSRKKTKLLFLVVVLIVGLKSFVFDTKYYYAATGSCLVQDVRYFKNEGYYKAIGNHKLLRKNPNKLTAENYESIFYLLNETDWLEENFPNDDIANGILIDLEYIKHNCKYVCSFIWVYNIIKCDIYRLLIPLNKSKYAQLYIPNGSFSIDDESDIEKYYDQTPKRVNNCFYEGLLLPPLTESEFKDWTE